MYTKEQLDEARTTDAYDFLLSRHGGEVKKEGAWLRVPGHGGVLVHRGYYGFYDASHDRHGNSVDLLMDYFGYDLKGAVEALIGVSGGQKRPSEAPERTRRQIDYAAMPKPLNGSYKRVFAYLIRTRGLPSDLVSRLVKDGLLYEDEMHNAVFVDRDGTIAEVRGTSTYVDFKSTRRTKAEAFWWFQPNGKSERVYICESAIDALSLYSIIKDNDATYVSMAGVGNRVVVERIRLKKPTFICTDNDEGGQKVRDAFPDLPTLIPVQKDWNDELKEVMRRDAYGREATA